MFVIVPIVPLRIRERFLRLHGNIEEAGYGCHIELMSRELERLKGLEYSIRLAQLWNQSFG